MSENDTAVLPSGPEPEKAGRGTRRTALVVGGTVAALLIGGGAFAAWQLLAAKGPAPEEALPTTTVGVVTVDLDPSAGQKVAALRAVRKFPALKGKVGLKDDEDLREFTFGKLQEEGSCEGLDYEDAVKPWLGKRAALAAVDLGDDAPAPALVVQVTDAAEARTGVQRLIEKCGDPGEDFGFTTTDDFLIVSDSEAHAQEIAKAGADKPLSDDASYQKWTRELGDAGVVNFYVSQKAATYLLDLGSEELGEMGAPEAEAMQSALEDFEGAAGTLRFADGGLEVATAAGGSERLVADAPVGDQVGALPQDTAVALGFGVPKDMAQTILRQLEEAMGPELEAQLSQLEAEFGLVFPEDVQTLLGTGITVSLGGDAPESFGAIGSPGDVPIGITIEGDPEKIHEVIGKVEEGAGGDLTQLGVATRDDDSTVAFASSDGYATALLEQGGLGEAAGFTGVVPEAADSSSILFVDFDSAWIRLLTDEAASAGEEDVAANIEPLEALGLSAWRDGDVIRGLLKLTTD